MSDPKFVEPFSREAFRGRAYGITGAAHGIGEAAAARLLKLGARVAVIDVDGEHLSRVRAAWKQFGDRVLLVRGDVAEDRVIKRAVAGAHRRWGRIDGWVSNAAFNPFGSVQEETPERFDRAVRVNLQAAWLAAKLALPLLSETGGSLVHVGSMLARMNYPLSLAYATTKAGLEGMTRAMAVELAPKRVRVNAVVPGMIDTFVYGSSRKIRARRRWPKDIPLEAVERYREIRRRFRRYQWQSLQPWPAAGGPEDVASAILFLLSDASAFITGESIVVDGGMTVHHPRMLSADLTAMAEDQRAMVELGERYPAMQMRGMLKYRNPAPARAPRPRRKR